MIAQEAENLACLLCYYMREDGNKQMGYYIAACCLKLFGGKLIMNLKCNIAYALKDFYIYKWKMCRHSEWNMNQNGKEVHKY